MKNKMLIFLAVLTIFAIACSTSEPTQRSQASPPPEPPKPAQPQAAPAPQPSQPAQTQQQPSQSAPVQPASTAKTVAVSIKGFKFTPADITINAGDTVVWTNEDSAPHTVESSDGTLRSDELSKGDTYSYKFTKAGKYNYICGIHPSMKGSVTVQ